MGIIAWIILGLVAELVAKILVPGRDPQGQQSALGPLGRPQVMLPTSSPSSRPGSRSGPGRGDG
ncbi:hypothetical protein ABH927_003532 [Planotetraspora sp. GP83]